MTAPAVSLYQHEMARRKLTMPRAAGCPRERAVQRQIEVRRTKRAAPPPADPAATRQRHEGWRRLYEDERLSVTEVAARVGVRAGSVSRALRKLGVVMRPKGHGEIVAQLKRENAALRGRILSLRHKLSHYEEGGA